jgi:polyphosphate kinase
MNNEGLTNTELQDSVDVAAQEPVVEVPPVVETPAPAVAAAITNLDDSSLYIHRELSQLQFNIRVLEQALF